MSYLELRKDVVCEENDYNDIVKTDEYIEETDDRVLAYEKDLIIGDLRPTLDSDNITFLNGLVKLSTINADDDFGILYAIIRLGNYALLFNDKVYVYKESHYNPVMCLDTMEPMTMQEMNKVANTEVRIIEMRTIKANELTVGEEFSVTIGNSVKTDKPLFEEPFGFPGSCSLYSDGDERGFITVQNVDKKVADIELQDNGNYKVTKTYT